MIFFRFAILEMEDVQVLQDNTSHLIVEDCEGEVECVRYCMVFVILLLVSLVVDPLPKLFPWFFIAKLTLYIWTLSRS